MFTFSQSCSSRHDIFLHTFMQQRASHISAHTDTHTQTHSYGKPHSHFNVSSSAVCLKKLISFYLKLCMNSVTIWCQCAARNHSGSNVVEDVTTALLLHYWAEKKQKQKGWSEWLHSQLLYCLCYKWSFSPFFILFPPSSRCFNLFSP